MATIPTINISSPGIVTGTTGKSGFWQPNQVTWLRNPLMRVRPMRATPNKISEKVVESIKEAEEKCADDPASGECAAAWDEVEELSAAASHARDKEKDVDPLEEFCKDNPETEECRTYED